MSTSSTASQRTRSIAPGDGAGRDGFIEVQLQRTSLQVKLVDLCSALMVLAVGVLSYLLVVAVVDHWVFPLGVFGRWTALLLLFVGVVYYFAAAVVPLLLGRINPVYAAHAIEQAEPSLKNSLVNYLLFRSDRAGVRMGIYQALEQRAASDLSHVDAETAVDRSRMIKIGYALVTVLVLCAAYTMLAPKSPFQSVARVLAPWADIARPSRVRIEDVQPGNAKVFQGQTLTVSARCYDLRDGEPATLFYSSLDGQLSRQTLTMSPLDGGLIHECTLPADSDGFQQDLVYWIQAGDAATPAYRVEVSPAPSILVDRIEYEFPAYTRLPNRVVEDRGDIQAIEGTRVTLHARANQTVAAAVLEFDPSTNDAATHEPEIPEDGLSLDASASRIEMSFAEQRAWCSFNLEMDEARQKPKYQSYQVRFLSEAGHANPHPVLHRLRVVRDLSPEIEILSPAVDRLEIPEDAVQKIEIRAIDPDYGLSQILLRAVAGGQQILSEALLQDQAGQIGQSIVHFDFQPRSLGLRAGDAVTYWAVAADNRHSQVTGDASPNTAKTREYTFVILPPEQTSLRDPEHPKDQPTDDPSVQDRSTTSETDPPSDDSSVDEAGDSPTGDDEAGSESGDETGAGDPSQQQGGSGSSGDTSEDSGTGQQSGTSGGSAGGEQQSGGDSSDTGSSSSSGSSASGGSSGDAGGQSSSNSGNTPGSPSDTSSQSGGTSGSTDNATGGAGGREEPLHDGEVFEKAMEYMTQKDDGRAAGTTDQPPGPGAEPTDRPTDATGQDTADSGRQDSDAGESDDSQSSPGDGQPTPSGMGDEQGRPADEPAPGAEESSQGAGKQKADQPGAKGKAGGGQKPEDAREQGGSSSDNANGAEGKKKSGSSSGQSGQSGGGGKKKPKGGQGAQQESSSGGASEKEPDGKKKAGGGSQSDSSSQPNTPSPSQPQSGAQGEESSDRRGGGSGGGGQGANQEGSDGAGSNKPSDTGAGAAEQSGSGDTSPDAGQSQQSMDATGQTGDTPGSGSDAQPGAGGGGGVGAQGESDQNSQTPPVAPANSEGQPRKSGPGVPFGGGVPSTGELKGFDITGEVPPGEKPNVEYARKATDMVLEYLKDQQQDPDQELLDELGWTKEDMRDFIERWETMKRSAVEAAGGQRELDDALRSLGLRSSANSPRSGSVPDDKRQAARNLGTRTSPPSTYAEQFNAYRKGTARTNSN